MAETELLARISSAMIVVIFSVFIGKTFTLLSNKNREEQSWNVGTLARAHYL